MMGHWVQRWVKLAGMAGLMGCAAFGFACGRTERGAAGESPEASGGAAGSGGNGAGSGESGAGARASGGGDVVTIVVEVEDAPLLEPTDFEPNEQTRWLLTGLDASAITELWAWPIEEGQVHLPRQVTPEGEKWRIEEIVPSPDGNRYAFHGGPVDNAWRDLSPAACRVFVIRSGKAGLELEERCYDKAPTTWIHSTLRWLDDERLLVGFKEPDQEEPSTQQVFLDDLSTGSTPIAPSFANVAAVSPAPDGQKFLVQRGWPDDEGTYLSLYPRLNDEPFLLMEGTRFAADEGAQWAPAGDAVSFIDYNGLGLVAFDLRGEPTRIDFDTLGLDVSRVREHAWGAGVLAFFVPGYPRIGLYDLANNELTNLPLPDGMSSVSALQWDRSGTTLVFLGYRTRPDHFLRWPLFKTTLDSEGAAGPVVALGADDAESFAQGTEVAFDEVFGLGETSLDAVSPRRRLFRWPLAAGSGRYSVHGDDHAGFDDADAFYASDSPAHLLLQMRSADSRYALFWLRGEGELSLPRLQSLPHDVVWLPGATGVVLRQGVRQALWSDLRSGEPAPWVEISVFE